jgi:hypothetical protein
MSIDFNFTVYPYIPSQGDELLFELNDRIIPFTHFNVLDAYGFLFECLSYNTISNCIAQLLPHPFARIWAHSIPVPSNNGLVFAQFDINSFGDSSITQALFASLSLGQNSIHLVSLDLPQGLTAIQVASLDILTDPVIMTAFISLDIINFIARISQYNINEFGVDSITTPIEPSTSPMPLATDDVVITFDGIIINNYIADCKINQRDSDIITSVEITFKDLSFFDLVDPRTKWGLPRIYVKIKDDEWWFLNEERSASEGSHTLNIWGRNPIALLLDPFHEAIAEIYFDELATAIADSLSEGYDIDWRISDYLVKDFSLSGQPLDGIQTLAQTLGGIVRSNRDASLHVRRRFPVLPVDLSSYVPTLTLDRYQHILSSDYSEEQPQFNSVRIVGFDSTNPEVSIEEKDGKSCILLGATATLKVYRKPDTDYILCSTAGTLTISKEDQEEIIEDEYVEITDESGSLSKYPSEVTSCTLEGSPKKPVQDEWPDDDIQSCETVPDPGIHWEGANVHINDCMFGKVKVTYKTIYDEWTFICTSEVESIVAALSPEYGRITIQVTAEDITDKVIAPEITDELLITEGYATERGLVELADVYYRKHKWTLKVPYQGILDGDIIRLEDDFLGILGNALVKTADVSIEWSDGLRVYQDLEVHQYSKP